MKINEDNYISLLRQKNEKALMFVIERYGGLLKAVIARQLFALPQRQEECFDDVLLKIWEHIQSFDESKNTFQNWIAVIAKYQAIDYLRQYQRELKCVDLEENTVSMEDRELERLIEEEISEGLSQMLSCLSETDRNLFLKLYVEQQPIEELAKETGMKKTAIYNRISKGKKKMRLRTGFQTRQEAVQNNSSERRL